MLQKARSKKVWQLKYLLLFPIVMGIIFYTSLEGQETTTQENDKDQELIEKIRKIDKDVKIIILTAHADNTNLLQAIPLNLINYLVKPVKKRDLDDVIFEIVNGFKQMQQNIDDAMREKAIEEENNKAKDAFLLKQSRFIEMGTMISNISHQWKQPLNVVELCMTDLTIKNMMGEVDLKYQEKLFKEIHNQVIFMSKTIDVFKNFLSEDYNEKNIEI